MPDLDRRQLALYAVGLLVVLVLGVRYLAHGDGTAGPAAARGGGSQEIRVERSGGGPVVVHVAGAVRDPGVYRLAGGARVADALERAGGATRRAELSAVNLAAKLEDGRQIVVPERPRAGASPAAASGAVGAASAGVATPAAPVNLNTGTPEQLDTLPGVGPATVQKIVEYREQHGGFGSIEELGQVPGIGDKRLAALRDKVQV